MARKFIRRLLKSEIPWGTKKKKKRRRVHINKYKHLAALMKYWYDARNKRYRDLPLWGDPGQVFQKGMIILYHGRRYRLKRPVIIPADGRCTAKFELCKRPSI